VTDSGLRAVAVGVDRGGQVILDDVTLGASAGEMLVVTGPSGSGKTTLAEVLAGIAEADRGDVTIAGAPLRQAALAHRPVLVPQDFGLVATLTAVETVGLPLQVRALEKEETRERSARWLGAVGLESCSNRLVNELSGGQRQRVSIARALAVGSSVIVMDEPTAELDPANRDLVLSLLMAERERGAALVVVSHETDVIARADVVYELAAFRMNHRSR
jgi:ABC-type lipoprotein export system ATPase subunit